MEMGNYPLREALVKAGFQTPLGWEEQLRENIKFQMASIMAPTEKEALEALRSTVAHPVHEREEIKIPDSITSIQISSVTLFEELGFQFGGEASEGVFVASGWSFIPVRNFMVLLSKKLSQGAKLQVVVKSLRKDIVTLIVHNLEYI